MKDIIYNMEKDSRVKLYFLKGDDIIFLIKNKEKLEIRSHKNEQILELYHIDHYDVALERMFLLKDKVKEDEKCKKEVV